jgi:hypothetical protein
MQIGEDTELELEKGLELENFESKLSLFLLLHFLLCSFTCGTERTFVALQFACPTTQKTVNLIKERARKMFNDR